jgi:hypothetical protein
MALRFFGDSFGEVLWDGPPLPAASAKMLVLI